MDHKNLKILAIDDNRDNLTALKAVVQDALPGSGLLSAPSGPRGLELARAEDPDVILLDIVMPGMDGFAVCRKLKEDERLRLIPVVFLTALGTDRENRIKALEAGAEGFLSKPWEESDLIAQIHAMAKIKTANRIQRLEKEQLAALVAERTRELEQELAERKRTEEALRESENRFREASLSITDIAYSCIRGSDGNHVIDWVTGATESFSGYSKDEFQALGCWGTLVPEDDGALFEKNVVGLAPGASGRCELRLRKKDGSLVWGASYCRCVTLTGKPGQTRLYGSLRDITKRKKAEEDLRQTNRFLDSIIENIPNMIFIKDAKKLRFIRFNRAGEDLLGYSRDDLLGKNDYDLFPKEQADLYTEKDREVLRGKDVMDIREEPLQTRYKGERTLHTKKVPILNAKGEPEYLLGISEDITEHLKMEAELQQAQKMESVGRLAGGVAHDYNNMLGVILGYAELALGKVDPGHPLHADLEEIRKAARRSVDITRQLLAFARKQTIAPEVLELNDTVEGMLKMLRRLIGEDLDLAWMPAAGLWPVKMDPSQVDQILANLCLNARDAIAGVGKLTIETQNVTFEEAYCARHAGFIPGEFVVLAVSDDGCGMDKETQELLFEPFFTTKEVGKGTGLGLATVYGIVKQNEGFINVYSEPGKGTTFKVYLPRHVGQALHTPAESAAEIPWSRGETVLLVEDEQAILSMSKMMLEKLGYGVLAAGTPGEAMRLAEEYPGDIHLLVTDVVMPEMTGRDLADRLQSLYPNLQRLFMSGYTANVIIHHGVLDRGVHFLEKPFSMQDLAVKVRKVMSDE
jgi:PAS domain S-box-containing protein